MQCLPFKSVLLGSHNDPYCSLERAQGLARAWGSEFVDCGAVGHVNAESGLGEWSAGYEMLKNLQNKKEQ
jgi:predicted alpha/beta hydrolase family esterase